MPGPITNTHTRTNCCISNMINIFMRNTKLSVIPSALPYNNADFFIPWSKSMTPETVYVLFFILYISK